MYVGLASAWNILGGYAGYINLGISAFYGIGGYSFAIFLHSVNAVPGYGSFLWVPLVGVFTAIVGVPLGWAACRTRHAVFVTVTVAMFFVVQLLAENWSGVTGGSTGYGFPIPKWSPSYYYKPFYYAMLAAAIFTVFISFVIRRSGFGLGLMSIRDDEDKAEAIGVPTTLYKVVAFSISAGLAGMIGAIFTYSVLYIYPQNAVDPLISTGSVLAAFLGGTGTLLGPVVGALILVPAQTELSYYVNGQLYLVLYGGLFLLIMRVLPRGILPTVSEFIRTSRHRRSDTLMKVPAVIEQGSAVCPDEPLSMVEGELP